MTTVSERFERLVNRNGEHHLWTGAVDRNQTPQIRVGGRLTTARRVAWELVHGPLEPGQRVTACVEPRCVRIDHLRLRSDIDTAPRAVPDRRRARRGDGWVREIRPGGWKVTVSGRDETGRTVRRSRTITGTCADVDRAVAELTVQLGGAASTLDVLVTAYLAHLQAAGRSPDTLRRYRQLWRQWLSPTLTDLDPTNVDRTDIEHALWTMHHAGQSRSSIHQAAVLLNSALSWRPPHANSRDILGWKLPDGTRIAGTRHR